LTLLLTSILIVFSIIFEIVATTIYFYIIRRTLAKLGEKLPSFDWLPHKRKAQIVKYKIIFENRRLNNIWGKVLIWLNILSWMFLLISLLLVAYMLFGPGEIAMQGGHEMPTTTTESYES